MRLSDLFGRHPGHFMAVHEQRHLGPPAAGIIVATSGRDRVRIMLPTPASNVVRSTRGRSGLGLQ